MSDILSAVYPVLFRGERIGEVTTQKKGAMTSFCASMDNRNVPERPILRLAAMCDGARKILGVPTPEGDILRLAKTLSPLELSRRGIGHIEYFILTEDTADSEDTVNSEVAAVMEDTVVTADTEDTEITEVAEIAAVMEDTEDNEDNEEPEAPAAEISPQAEENIETQLTEKNGQESKSVPRPDGAWLRVCQPDIHKPDTVPEKIWREEYDLGRHLSDPDLIRACENVLGAMVYEGEEETLLAIPADPSRPFPLISIFLYGSAEKIGDSIYVVFKVKNGEIIG